MIRNPGRRAARTAPPPWTETTMPSSPRAAAPRAVSVTDQANSDVVAGSLVRRVMPTRRSLVPGPPAASRAALRTAPDTVCGISWSLRSNSTAPPSARTASTAAGPAAVKSSIPTLNQRTAGRRSAPRRRASSSAGTSRATTSSGAIDFHSFQSFHLADHRTDIRQPVPPQVVAQPGNDLLWGLWVSNRRGRHGYGPSTRQQEFQRVARGAHAAGPDHRQGRRPRHAPGAPHRQRSQCRTGEPAGAGPQQRPARLPADRQPGGGGHAAERVRTGIRRSLRDRRDVRDQRAQFDEERPPRHAAEGGDKPGGQRWIAAG